MAKMRSNAKSYAEACLKSQPYIEFLPSGPRSGWVLPALDMLAILALPLLGAALEQVTENLPRYLLFWAILAGCSVGLTASHSGYTPGGRWRQGGVAGISFLATAAALLALVVLFNHPGILLKHWTLLELTATPALLVFTHAALPARAPPANAGATLVVCYDRCPPDLALALAEQKLPSRIAGVLYLASLREAGSWPELLDSAELLQNFATQIVQDVVFVHHPELEAFNQAPQKELLQELLTYPARIWLAFDLSANLPDMLRTRTGGCKLVPVVTDELITSSHMVKRGV